MTFLDQLRSTNPLTICITNDVVKNFTANGLLALGASPAMSEYKDDLEDMLPHAGGLLINIGTLTDLSWQLFKDALDIAEKHRIPTVLDPVAAGAGKFRKKVALDLIENHHISLIRGNAGEIASLIGETVVSKGVDSSGVENVGELALRANQVLGIPIVITGKIDAIAVEGQLRLVSNGSEMMPFVTGTGCLLGAVLAAFMSFSDSENLLSCLEEALVVYAIAGEMAEQEVGLGLPGSFQIAFLDALAKIQNEAVLDLKKVVSYG